MARRRRVVISLHHKKRSLALPGLLWSWLRDSLAFSKHSSPVRILPNKPNREAFFALQTSASGSPPTADPNATPEVLGLIVTCEECSTSFQLDESRIPETGARVRCSRCKHAFFLPNPTASQSQVADSIAEEAAGDSLASVPTATPDLSSSALGNPTESATDPTTGTDAPDASEPEEEDWEFSEEIRNEGDEDLDEDEASSSSDVFGTGLDVEAASENFSTDDLEAPGFEAPAPEAAEAAEAADERHEPTVRDESDFGSVDDFSSLMEEEEVESIDLSPAAGSETQLEEPLAPSSGVYSSTGTSDDLGDPESWDLVGSDEFAVAKPLAAPIQSSPEETFAGVEDFFGDDAEATDYEEEVGPAGIVQRTMASVGRGIGWLATIVMVGAVLFFGLQGEWTRGAQTEQIVSAGGLTAQTTQASWVETSRSGYVLVVEGQLRNEGAESLWPGTLQLALLDANGGRLTEEPIGVGEPMSAVVLREGSPDELVAMARASALRLGDTPIGPGETRAFEAIALEARLPGAASRILLEMSAPGAVAKVQPAQLEAKLLADGEPLADQEPSAD
jgi:predicted Zn finger-like uncharacterized protein